MTSPTSATGGRTARRARSGWILYDVANSAFVTTVVTALGGPYLTALATAAAGPGGRVDLLGWEPRAGSVYAYVTSASVVVQVVLLPLLGALADRARGKQRLLAGGTVVGVLATTALALATGWQLAALALLVANVAFGAAIVAYNAFLADVAPAGERDKVSSQGFAAGYLGGAAVLALALVALKVAPGLGVPTGTVVRGAVVLAGLWWGGFGLVALARLSHVGHDPGSVAPAAGRSFGAQLRTSVRDLRVVAGELRRLPLTARFLVAFLLFNDAIQAVVAMSSVFLTQELYVAEGRPAEDATPFLLALILMIQVVAVVGALGFARLAARVGTKSALLVSLLGWVGVVVYAYLALRTTGQAWALGAVIALVLGGSQALARSLFSQMVPDGRQAAFFGIYELAERGTAWIGTLIFAVVVDVTGSYRLAILSLLVLFVSGGLLLVRTDTEAAIRAARSAGDRRAAAPGAGSVATAPRERTYRTLLRVLRLLVVGCTRTERRGLAHLPATGPVIVVGNHLSVADGFVLVDTVGRAGRRVRMMGTAGLFRAPVVGAVLRKLGFVPVFRRSGDPASALAPAGALLRRGECVGLYPEGRITVDPAHRPGRGKTGVVRLALDSGAPVVPVVQWGTQHVVAEGTPWQRLRRALLLPLRRPPVQVVVGPPLDLRAALGMGTAAGASPELLRVGADLVMAAITLHVDALAGRADGSRLGDGAGEHLAVAVDRLP